MMTVAFNVKGERRVCLRERWDRLLGPKPPEGFATDGCSFSPDYIAHRPVWPACIVHDYHYSAGEAKVSRRHADWVFFRNLYRLLRMGGMFFGAAFVVSAIYWWAVRTKGRGAYTGGGNPK